MPSSTNMHKYPSLSGRLVQVDSRKRMTVSSLIPREIYFVRTRDDGTLVILPRRIAKGGGRMVRVDARKRLTIQEMNPGGLYLAHELPDGTTILEPAVVLPKRTATHLRVAVS